MKKKINKKKKFNLDEIADFMDKVDLGHKPTVEEIDTIGEYIDGLKNDSQHFDEGQYYE